MAAQPFSIMCFSWNAAGLRLCETMSQTKANDARQGFRAFITMKQPCVAPDFFEEIRAIIYARLPTMVVMATEDEDSSGTYFHSDLLPKSMPEIGYSQLKRDKLEGVGETSLLPDINRIKSGKPSGSALRMSIYVRSEIISEFQYEEKRLSKLFGDQGQTEVICNQGDRTSGAIGAHVWHEVYGKFLFIGTHLAPISDGLRVGGPIDFPTYRTATRASNTLCLISIFTRLIGALPEEYKPDHIILLGDLNYDIVIPGKDNDQVISQIAGNITASAMREYQKYDELKKALDDAPLYGFKEGAAGEGPLFPPSWKLARNRPDSCVPTTDTKKLSVNCFGKTSEAFSGVGWHDRILYKENMTSDYMLHCTDYNRLDIKNMHASTHAGVTAFFEVKPIL